MAPGGGCSSHTTGPVCDGTTTNPSSCFSQGRQSNPDLMDSSGGHSLSTKPLDIVSPSRRRSELIPSSRRRSRCVLSAFPTFTRQRGAEVCQAGHFLSAHRHFLWGSARTTEGDTSGLFKACRFTAPFSSPSRPRSDALTEEGEGPSCRTLSFCTLSMCVCVSPGWEDAG